MRHRRAVLTVVLAGLVGALLAGSAAGSSGVSSPGRTGVHRAASTAGEARPPAGPSAEFVAPLYLTPSEGSGRLAPDDGGGVLTPGTVQVPDGTPVPRVVPRAEFRPA